MPLDLKERESGKDVSEEIVGVETGAQSRSNLRMSQLSKPVMMALLMDVVNVSAHLCIYGAPLLPAIVCMPGLKAKYGLVCGVALSAALFTAIFSILIILLISLARLGFANLEFFRPLDDCTAWAVAMLVCMIYRKSVVRSVIHSVAFLRSLFYRAIGGSLPVSTVVGCLVDITDPWATSIGKNCVIGDYAFLNAHEIAHRTVYSKQIKVGDHVTIGHHSKIGPGVTIEDHAIVAADALVLKDTHIKSYEIWGGIPAKKIGVSSRRRG